jgi:glyoxylate reductase
MKLIANFGNGVDNIDVDAAQKKGITVTNTPNVLSDDTADMTMALMLAVPRRLTEGANVLVGAMMAAGRAGRRPGCLATALAASGWASSAWAVSAPLWPAAPRHLACRSIITTAAGSIRTLRISLRPPTGTAWTRCWRASTSFRSTAPRHPPPSIFCRAVRLNLMKPGAYIVNTARGGIIDEDALIKALREGRLVRRRARCVRA